MISLLALFGICYPARSEASVFSQFSSLLQGKAEASSQSHSSSVQTMSLPKPAMNIDPSSAKGGGDVTIVDGEALLPAEGPSGTLADISKPKNSSISLYVVQEGNTISSIAKMFGVTSNTIMWANNIPAKGTIHVGQTLTILPVTGIKYSVKSGDTLASVAKKFGGDAAEIASFNGVEGALTVGSEIIIPDGEVAFASPSVAKPAATASGSLWKKVVDPNAVPGEYSGYYIRPIVGGVRTQGVHGYNGVDLAAPVGTPILASAAGDVIIAKMGGWNSGYGNYVVIKHDNGTQTLYAHQSSVIVGVGESVVQGQVIGYVGATGKATGPHVHFEIRGGPRNPF